MSTIIKGTGPHHVILLNGWFGRAEDWGPFADHLDLDNFTWHFFDYRGYGSRKEETGDFTLAEVSSDVCDYIGGLDVEKLSLLGHSMGGVFMQRVLLDTDAPISALVGISSVPASGTPLDADSRELFESAGANPPSRRAIIDFTTGSRLPDVWLDAVTNATITHSAPEAVSNYFRAWADCSFAEELATQNLPVLVVTGALDPAVSKDVVEATFGGTYPNLQVEELPDTGHYAIFEHPLGLASRVMNFLGNVD